LLNLRFVDPGSDLIHVVAHDPKNIGSKIKKNNGNAIASH